MSKPSPLCDRCKEVSVESLQSVTALGAGIFAYGLKHYDNFHDLAKSAAKCALCATISAAMQKKDQIINDDENVINDQSAIRLVGFPLTVRVPATVDSDGNKIPETWSTSALTGILAGNAFMRGWLSIYTDAGE